MARPRFLFAYKQSDIYGGRGFGSAGWRLLGANNRELGRGPALFADLESCQAAVRELAAHIAAATPGITSDADRTGAWNWRLELGGRVVAVSWRSYLRHRECTYSLAHFIDAVPNADVPALAPAPVSAVSDASPVDAASAASVAPTVPAMSAVSVVSAAAGRH
jgi:hypothetical protein